MITKKRGRPATGINLLIGVRLPPDLLSVLDRYIKEEQPEMTRPEALRHAFRDWAISMGYDAGHKRDTATLGQKRYPNTTKP